MEKAKCASEGRVPKGCRFVDPAIVQHMRAIARGQSDESLNDQFQISYNTWRKLLAGAPVRSSLADRLEARLRTCEYFAAARPAVGQGQRHQMGA